MHEHREKRQISKIQPEIFFNFFKKNFFTNVPGEHFFFVQKSIEA